MDVVEVVEAELPRTVPRTDLREEEAPRRRIKVMIPLPVSTHPVAAIQQRSAVQRRTPPRKLEGENPNGFRSKTASKTGSNCGATGFRGRGVAHRPWGLMCVAPPPRPLIIYVARRPLGRNKGGWGVQLGLPNLPNHPTPSHRKPVIFGFWYSH